LVTIADTRAPHAPHGPPIKRTTSFNVASWDVHTGVTLPEPSFSGEIPFPFENKDEH
jgi:hypothetical protein